jgi:hypothetical protein
MPRARFYNKVSGLTEDGQILRYDNISRLWMIMRDDRTIIWLKLDEFEYVQPVTVEALLPYLGHKNSCSVWRPVVGCDCGLEGLLKNLKK